MTRIARKFLTVTAAASLVTLTACGGPGVEDPPALSEIDDLMWETMQQEGSVTITANAAMLADDEAMGDDAFTEIFGADMTNMKIYGPLDGSATAISMDDTDLVRVFDQEEAYLAGDALFGIMGNAGPALGGSEQDILDAMSEEFAGTWIDFSSELDADAEDFNIGALFTELQESWSGEGDSSDSPIDRDEVSDDGTHEVREEVDVWVYSGHEDGQELVLEANHEAPKIMAISDNEMTMTFTDWGETESPERPEESNVIGQAELEERMMELFLSGL